MRRAAGRAICGGGDGVARCVRVGGEGSCVVILCAWDFRYAQIDHNTRITRHRLGTRNLSAGRSAHRSSNHLKPSQDSAVHLHASEAATSADEEAETSADASRADPGTGEPEQTRHRPPRERWEEARGGRRPRPTYGGPVARRRRADDVEAEQTRRASETKEGAGLCGDQQEDPRDHVEDG